jgi:hypothetical protein
MAAGEVELLLIVGGLYAEAKLVNIKEGDMDEGWGEGPGKSDKIATFEALKEKEERILVMCPQ